MSIRFTRRNFLATSSVFAASACSTGSPMGGAHLTETSRLHIDGLSFLRDDAAQLEKSGLHAAIVDVSDYEQVTDENGFPKWIRTFEACDKNIELIRTKIGVEYKNAFVADKGTDIDREGQTAIFFQFQSCEPLEGDVNRIDYFHEKGLRVLQLTHHHNNPFAGGTLEAQPSGLTALGREGVARMNRLKIVPDVSHGSERTALDVADVTTTPFILSHGACRAIVDNPRCVSDEVIRAIAKSGGVMGIFMMSFWLTTDPEPTVDHYIAQLRHLANVGGIEVVAISNDFALGGHEDLKAIGNDNAEGVKAYHEWWSSINDRGVSGFEELPAHVVIPELNTIDRMTRIERALEADAFFTSSDIDRIMGGNWRRALTDVLG